jgi:hypothetical protein
VPADVFLLSPAFCGGRRGAVLLKDGGTSTPALLLAAGTLSLGDAFSFVSGLYFRGKLAYARRFANPPDPGNPVAAGGVLVITPNTGLRSADTPVKLASIREFAGVDIDGDNPAYRLPLEHGARALCTAIGPECEVVLLGSIASGKYVDVLLPIFGERLAFPPLFVGRGDMSRGGLMLRCVTAGVELEYGPLAGAIRRGSRPPRLAPLVKRRQGCRA